MTLRPSPIRRRRQPGRERGDILLVTMIFLLVCLLGLLTSTRSSMVETLLTGNTLARQKDVQVADIALRQVESQINAVYGGVPLETSAINQTWYRDVTAGTGAPGLAYWDSCLGSSTAAQRCGAVTLTVGNTTLPYTAYAVVQPTGRYDTTSCSIGSAGQYTAEYYDVFLHVKEANGGTVVNTETVYKICTLTT